MRWLNGSWRRRSSRAEQANWLREQQVSSSVVRGLSTDKSQPLDRRPGVLGDACRGDDVERNDGCALRRCASHLGDQLARAGAIFSRAARSRSIGAPHLHPSARPTISSGASTLLRRTAETSLTDAPMMPNRRARRRVNRRSFTDEEKRAIVMETEQAGVSVAAICASPWHRDQHGVPLARRPRSRQGQARETGGRDAGRRTNGRSVNAFRAVRSVAAACRDGRCRSARWTAGLRPVGRRSGCGAATRR